MAQLHSARCPGGLTHQPHHQQCKRHSARCLGGLTSHHQQCKRHHWHNWYTPGQQPPRCITCSASGSLAHVYSCGSFRALPAHVLLRPLGRDPAESTRAERLRHRPLLAEAFRAARPPRISQPSTVLPSRSLFSNLRFVCWPLDWCHVVSGHLSAGLRAALVDRSTELADPVRSLQVVCVRAARVRAAHFSNPLV